ncbi:hypothetical protein ACOMHN_001960 [Nucella lapillus]
MLRCFSLGSDVLLVTSLLVVTQLSALASSVSAPQLKEKLFSLLPLNDVLFTENVILGVSAMSRIDCSKKCVETRGCVMWTFHPSTRGPPAVCRLHRLLAGSADAKRAMSGAVTFDPLTHVSVRISIINITTITIIIITTIIILIIIIIIITIIIIIIITIITIIITIIIIIITIIIIIIIIVITTIIIITIIIITIIIITIITLIIIIIITIITITITIIITIIIIIIIIIAIITIIIIVITALQQSCAEGYVVRCGRCLKPVDQHVEYSEAASRCRLSQGQVFMPKTQGEVTCAHQLLLEFGVVKAWLGASDRVSARVFRWNDGTLLPGSSPLWSTLSGDPENSNPGNDCVFIYNTEAKIRDHHCTSDRAYICQREAM